MLMIVLLLPIIIINDDNANNKSNQDFVASLTALSLGAPVSELMELFSKAANIIYYIQ